jgi:hypothetical protein
MEEIIKQLLQYAPNTVVNLLIAYFFLDYMKKRDKATSEMLQTLGDSCHESHERVHKNSNDALDKNTRALERNSEALGYVSKKVMNGQHT